MTTSTPLDLTEDFAPTQVVQVNDHEHRAHRRYDDNQKPYADSDQLSQKLWSVVNAELGPNAADVLARKLEQAVVDHVTKGGMRR
ncbi:hypothetical protein AB0425_17295 [Actinosynnema sp. NPDC051121]